MANSFSITSSSTYEGRKMTLTCKQTQDIANNRSKIDWTLATTGSSTWYSTGPTKVVINGTTVYSKERLEWSAGVFPVAQGSTSGSLYVNHTTDGSKSIAVSLSTAIYTYDTVTNSGTWKLDAIPRKATIKSAPNFNDEGNPTITYENLSGNAVTTLQACISLDGSKADIAYRDISKTGTSYTFNLTDAEREVLRKATTTANTRTVYFYVKTIISGTTYTHKVAKTLTITNCAPTLSPTAVDTNATTNALTGDANKIVKGYSVVNWTTGASAKKHATISSQSVTYGGKKVSGASGTITGASTGTFDFSVTDSRGNTATKKLTKTLIDYVKVSCVASPSIPTAAGDMTLKINGNYFNGSFGAVANTLTVKYKMAVNGGTYGDWQTATATKSGNSYSVNVSITGLDYQNSYSFIATASDKLSSATSEEKTVKATPVFDWGENDFNFNVAVNISPEDSDAEGLSINNDLVLRHKKDGLTIISATDNQIVFRPQGNNSNENEQKIFANGAMSWFPVGSIYTTATNSNPASYLGGTWSLINKQFTSYAARIDEAFTVNSTNATHSGCWIVRNGASIRIRVAVATKVALADTEVELGTFNFDKIGITDSHTLMCIVGHTDGGNALIQGQLIQDTGLLKSVDVLGKGSATSVATGSTINFDFTMVFSSGRMLDSACNQFLWRRTA